ncbi:hypothetical protein ACFL0M_05390 [Thermodesulfobacteriota bacterium]
MSQQMSLFPAKDLPEEKKSIYEGESNALDEMLAATQRFRSSHEYIQMLQFISRIPNYSAFNGFLLHTQNPEISFVATAGNWRKRFKRHLKTGARPLVILAPMSPVRFVYDISDTVGDPIPPVLLKPVAAAGRLLQELFENTVHNCALHGIMVRQILLSGQPEGSAIHLTDDVRPKYQDLNLESGMNYLILLHKEHRLADRYAALVHELGHIFGGHKGIDRNAWWQDRRKLDSTVLKIEAESIAFLICQRKGLSSNADLYLLQYRRQDQKIPLLGFNAVLQATNYIEAMGQSRWKKPKKSR